MPKPKAKPSEPIGVSQWKEQGKEYGYWDFFKKEIIYSCLDRLPEVLDEISSHAPVKVGDACWILPKSCLKTVRSSLEGLKNVN